MNRRTFIKTCVWGGIFSGTIGPSRVLGALWECPKKDDMEEITYCWKTTIFCQVDNPFLTGEIEKLANRDGYKIYYGEPFSPDIIAIPYFVAVVDRSLIGKKIWELYLRYLDESGDETPCLVIDRLKYPHPVPKNAFFLDPKEIISFCKFHLIL
jgi:hypothetical protein